MSPAVSAVEAWAISRQTSLRLRLVEPEGVDGVPAVIVVHGLETSVDALREAVEGLDPLDRLAAEGLRVLALDWPGHGRSGGRRGHLTYRLAMEAVATAVDQARQRWPDAPLGILGTGLGGALAFYGALEDDRLGAVVSHDALDLRDARGALRRWRQRAVLPIAARAAARLPESVSGRVMIPARVVVAGADVAGDPLVARALRHHPQAVRAYDLAGLRSLLLTPQDKPDLAAGTAPTLVAVGSEDRMLTETTARAFASRLQCPQELWVLPGGGHQLLLEHPDAFIPVAASFLRRHLTPYD